MTGGALDGEQNELLSNNIVAMGPGVTRPIYSQNSFLPAAVGISMLRNIDKFCDLLKPAGTWSEKKNMNVPFIWLGLDIKGGLAYRSHFRCMEDEDNHALAESVITTSTFTCRVAVSSPRQA